MIHQASQSPSEGRPSITAATSVAAAYLALEGALREARSAGSETNRLECLHRAESIVLQLGIVLDGRSGGEVARRLAALYHYLESELLVLRRSPDEARLDELVELAAALRAAATMGAAA
ncbi:MAG TPA: flagellar protein FliS [Gemmatimonadaceae bacterium]|nr:flagellar protein FliS [Gemmatimonadaceae bacterium]